MRCDLLLYSQEYKVDAFVMTFMLTVPQESQWRGAERPKQLMAKWKCEPPVFCLDLFTYQCNPGGSLVNSGTFHVGSVPQTW